MPDIETSVTNKESLSALMDGEAQEFEARLLLRRYSEDSALRAQWARYHMASAIINNQPYSAVKSFRLADAVREAILKETVSDKQRESSGALPVNEGWRRTFSRTAIAASVAFFIVAGVQLRQQHDVVTEQVAVAAAQPSDNSAKSAPLNTVVNVPMLAGGALAQSRDKQNNRYMQYNFEHASLDTGVGKVPLIYAAENRALKK